MSLLQTPLRAGAFHLRNRIVMAPLTRCRSGEGWVPTALMADYYRQRASAGMILSEATAVDPMGVGYPDTPGIWSPEQVEGWKRWMPPWVCGEQIAWVFTWHRVVTAMT